MRSSRPSDRCSYPCRELVHVALEAEEARYSRGDPVLIESGIANLVIGLSQKTHDRLQRETSRRSLREQLQHPRANDLIEDELGRLLLEVRNQN